MFFFFLFFPLQWAWFLFSISVAAVYNQAKLLYRAKLCYNEDLKIPVVVILFVIPL